MNTYSEAQARAMVRGAVRWAREMPEAREETIVGLALAEAGMAVGVYVPPLPPEVGRRELWLAAARMRGWAAAAAHLAREYPDDQRHYLAEAALHRWLACILDQEAARREQAGAAQGQGEWSSRD